MSSNGNKAFPPIGFLTVMERQEVGWIGGYLVLNAAGRPLEFHCTAPVKPNRAQEILYGPTLKPFLFGEQIGHTLVAKSTLEPMFVCTDIADVLSLQDLVPYPVLFLIGDEQGNKSGDAREWKRIDGPQSGAPSAHSVRVRLGKREGVLAPEKSESSAVAEKWKPFADNLDLLEPFARIREALEETQRTAK